MTFNDLLNNKQFIILDGAMGTKLLNIGMKIGDIPEVFAYNNPEIVTGIHRQYVEAGADIIYSNSIGANAHKLKNSGFSVDKIVKNSISNAKKACNTDTLVAYEMGPIGILLEPNGNLKFEEAYDMYKEQVVAARDTADLFVIETMSDLLEVKACVLAVKENSDLPIICTMTFEKNKRTFTGTSVEAMAITLDSLDVDAMGINCSVGPIDMLDMVDDIAKWTNKPIIIKPNAGLPDPETGKFNVTKDEFAKDMQLIMRKGVQLIGGCCGTDESFISELSKLSKTINKSDIKRKEKSSDLVLCSSTEVVVVNEPQIIGERINPTGKKLFKEALLNNDIDYILKQAIEQVNAGASILDINVGLPGINEAEMMVNVIKAVQGVVNVPLQIDSTKPDVIEAALRVYNGKAIVNSVNAEKESLNTILPIAAKYNCALVGLTLDESGVPDYAESRYALAKKILKASLDAGIRKENLIIDCLTLTASAKQREVNETLIALSKVKRNLKLKTVLGVSNVSFGLPNRELINRTFLTMALYSGLDLAIINPNIAAMTNTILSYKVLMNNDSNSLNYIEKSISESVNLQGTSSIKNIASDTSINKEKDIIYSIKKGLKDETTIITKNLLKDNDPMTVIDNYLIPALDQVGEAFEAGKLFLPQLILAANAAKAGFDIIKEHTASNNSSIEDKGKVVLATVKGDIHDIGKNIVKALLENSGFKVIDLGKDVEPARVLEAAIKENVRVVGLSALMTTTLPSMEETIQLIKNNNANCKIIVGGAVLTEEYAHKIGSDYYAKNAKETVDIARKIYQENK